MKKMEKYCPICGEKFEYIDLRNEPKTCGSRMCRTNYEYIQKHMDPLTGKKPSPERIREL